MLNLFGGDCLAVKSLHSRRGDIVALGRFTEKTTGKQKKSPPKGTGFAITTRKKRSTSYVPQIQQPSKCLGVAAFVFRPVLRQAGEQK
jgi:hypothetical protein